MLHKLTLAAVTALGLTTPLALPSTAEAGPEIRIDFRAGSGFSRYPGSFGRPAYPVGSVPGRFPAPGYVRPHTHGHHYHVLYRVCDHDPWQTYGTYTSHRAAHDIEDYLQARGYEARIRHH
jgi:hypothetical protein